jgi:cell wall-associated NlpC family hydrolase
VLKALLNLLRGWLLSQATEQQLAAGGIGGRVVTVHQDISATGYDRQAEETRQRQAIVAFARSQKGKPYRYAIEALPKYEAEAPAWDCSELVEASFRVAGLTMPDGCAYERPFCRPVKLHGPAPGGDLIFLEPNQHGIPHVLLHSGDGTVVHAVSGRGVVEDPVSMWETHPRYAGTFRHPDFQRPPEDR